MILEYQRHGDSSFSFLCGTYLFAQPDSVTPCAITLFSHSWNFAIYGNCFYNSISFFVLFRSAIQGVSARRKEDEDADRHLAQTIMQNKQYSLSGRADDEYDFDDGPRRKSGRKGRDSDHKVSNKNDLGKRILTQQERCNFCFENPNRPKHLVVSIANFTYLMLPQWQPIVPGHCCILPMQVSLV